MITLTKEEYEHKIVMLAKARVLKSKANQKINEVQKRNMDKAIELEDMIAIYRMNVVNKNPEVHGDNEKSEIAMIPIYEIICNMKV